MEKIFEFEFLKYENFMVWLKINQIKTKPLYNFLKNQGFSERYLTFLRKSTDNILINGKPSKIIDAISSQDLLSLKVDFTFKRPQDFAYYPKYSILKKEYILDIVFEDDFFLIVNKPALLASIPTKSHFNDNLLLRSIIYLSQKNQDKSNLLCAPRILNRLDFDTAGLIVIAKNLFACILATKANFQKTYYALCNGLCKKNLINRKEIITLKDENNINIRRRILGQETKNIQTTALPVSFNEEKNLTLFKVEIKGGKTHQIRVHLSSLGFDLVGDEIYGKKENFITHTALVCKELNFIHPLTNEKMVFTVPFPKDIENLLQITGSKIL